MYKNIFVDIPGQIKILEQRGMIVDDHSILHNINYSHIIYRYGLLYQKPVKDNTWYKAGTKISHLYNLFELNSVISEILFSFFNKFEHKFKQAVAHTLSKHGPLDYADYSKFVINDDYSEDFYKKILDIEEKCRNYFIPEMLIDGKLPIWLLVDELQLKQLDNLSKYLGHQEEVLKYMKLSNTEWRVLEHIRIYRNRISHFNPLSPKVKGTELIQLLRIVERFDKVSSIKIKNYINSYDYQNKLNMQKKDLLDYLRVSKFFE